MKHGWYSPEEQWPVHKQPWFKKALKEARRSGWHLFKFNDHSYGRVFCSRDEGACEFLVLSTAKGSEGPAKDLQKMVQTCPHRDASEVSDALLEAQRLIARAERLIVAAEKLCQRALMADDAAELMTRAEELENEALERTQEAEDLLRQAIETEQDGRDVEQDALHELRAHGVHPPVDAQQVATIAEDTLSDAEAVIDAGILAPHREERQLRQRIATLRDRIASLPT